MADARRLGGPEVEERLARIDDSLGYLEGVPGRTSEAGVTAVRNLAEVYGEALARLLDLLAPDAARTAVRDELLGHLLALHDLHPDPPTVRVERVLDALRPGLGTGGDAELLGIQDGVAHVRLTVRGCGSSAGAAEDAVRDAVTAAAPELRDVRRAPDPERAPAFVPLDTLRPRPSAAPAGGTG
ncbi:NifU family protein [Yinghuangia sp. ASG 101]|uniref:NifU family protein n=1 Tax=Yinghuangia sp. ASG 101 TaxID=2896848 RepID=UPI001E61EB01|nr:NifU family protein [Yinghuangia sp. ASG 101]UGQ11495.1 NifU family protein [Yinghuangia sp. ASG 101]